MWGQATAANINGGQAWELGDSAENLIQRIINFDTLNLQRFEILAFWDQNFKKELKKLTRDTSIYELYWLEGQIVVIKAKNVEK